MFETIARNNNKLSAAADNIGGEEISTGTDGIFFQLSLDLLFYLFYFLFILSNTLRLKCAQCNGLAL